MFTIQVMNDLTWVIFLLIVSASKGAFESHVALSITQSVTLATFIEALTKLLQDSLHTSVSTFQNLCNKTNTNIVDKTIYN